MVKINFLTGSLALRNNRTGVHEYHHQLISEISKIEQDYVVSCYDTESNLTSKIDNLSDYIYHDHILYSNKLVRVLSYLFPIELFFGKANIYVCDGLIPRTIFRGKRIAIIFDLMVKRYPENYSYIKKLYLNYYFHRCKKADAIVVDSECTKADVVSFLGIPEDKIHVAYCGCEIQECSDSHYDLAPRSYLLYIGDMRPNKNLLNALRAFKIVLQKIPYLKFVIAGSKSGEYQKLVNYVNKNNLTTSVLFLGYVTNKEKFWLLKNAYALLFVSQYEGFGIPPVVTSNVSSLREIGQNASILVNQNDPLSIANGVESLQDESTRIAVIANQIEKYGVYTWEKTAQAVEEVVRLLSK